MVYGKVERYMTEKISSIEQEILLYHQGLVLQPDAAAVGTAIPCDIESPSNVLITPLSTNGSSSVDNTIPLVGGYSIVSLEPVAASDLSIATVPNWAATTAYLQGEIVQESGVAYVCTEEHTSGASFDSTYWTKVRSQKFLEITHAAGAFQFTYKVEGISS